MPWCGWWGAAGSAFWWVVPLIGLAVMGVMFFVCFRRVGCMGGCGRPWGRSPDPGRDAKEEVHERVRQP